MTKYHTETFPYEGVQDDLPKQKRARIIKKIERRREQWRGAWGAEDGLQIASVTQRKYRLLLTALMNIHIVILAGFVPDLVVIRTIRNLATIEMEILRPKKRREYIDEAVRGLLGLRTIPGFQGLADELNPHLTILEKWSRSLADE